MVIDHNSVLCLKHFAPIDVAVFNNGDQQQQQKNNGGLPLVKEGASPLFFPNEMAPRMSELKVRAEQN